MIILSCNCRGLRKPSTVQRLRRMVKEFSSECVFLCESMVPLSYSSRLLLSLGFPFGVGFGPDKKKGGLVFAWRDPITCSLISDSPFWLHIRVSIPNVSCYFFTAIYGPPSACNRPLLWNFLNDISGHIDLPWLLFGDFNQVICKEDKYSASSSLVGASRLQSLVDQLALVDLGAEGNWFTWHNNHTDASAVWERLDRVFGSDLWVNKFPFLM